MSRVTAVPPTMLNNTQLTVVEEFKYLGNILTSELNYYDLDMENERRALAVQSNCLPADLLNAHMKQKLRFLKPTANHFRALSSLSVRYTKWTYSALRVQYSNAFRVLMGTKQV